MGFFDNVSNARGMPGTITSAGYIVGPDGNALPQTTSPFLQQGDVGYNSNDARNGGQANPNYIAGSTTPTSLPPLWTPSPFVMTPAQNVTSFTPPPNTGIIPPDPNSNTAMTGKGAGKGPTSGQPVVPAQGSFTPMASPPLDFHTQLQNFINSGLLGSQQRLSG